MNLNHLAVFLAVAQHRSLTRAAAALGADKGNVSRVLKALEHDLGVVLLTRTTRAVTLTPAGEDLFARAAVPLAALDAITQGLTDRPVTPSGWVTLATTHDLGRALVGPLLTAFRARYPEVRVHMTLGSSLVPMPHAKVDLALRVGTAGSSDTKVRRVGALSAGFFASPRYLAARGTPRALAELARHDGLWPRAPGRGSFRASTPPPPAVDCEDFAALLEIARAGGGIAVLPVFMTSDEVARGGLVRVLPQAALPSAPVFLVTGPARPLPPRVAVLRDYLAEHIPRTLAAA